MRSVNPGASFTPMPPVHIHELVAFSTGLVLPLMFSFPRLANRRCSEFTDFCLFMSLKENVGKQKLFLAVDVLSGCLFFLDSPSLPPPCYYPPPISHPLLAVKSLNKGTKNILEISNWALSL